ncbi:MAG TPA: FAD-dependent oxidoreductase [Rheinheimera sp.]|uniref:NAD(P)/FAD-dependent oxidoreductase n=1 Tax=Rheinheimera sp. TaxID=1869214 RepID=UPI002F932F50
MTIAIIGAGIAGAACAAALAEQGEQVVVFEKGRRAGGRMSSKRTEHGYLDLGAQYFTARDPAFQAQCQQWLSSGIVTHWYGRLAQATADGLQVSPDETLRYIGMPSMQAPVTRLLGNVDVSLGRQIDNILFDGQLWQLQSNGVSAGRFNKLILAIPQQQAAALLNTALPSNQALSKVFELPALLPCWAVNIQVDQPLWPYDGIFFKQDSQLSWAARQGSKPGRCNAGHWLLHFTAAFSQQQLEADGDTIAQHAMQALQRLTDKTVAGQVSHYHRWRFAQQNPDYPVQGVVHLPELALGLAGDWLNGGRVENAWLSGRQLAQSILA